MAKQSFEAGGLGFWLKVMAPLLSKQGWAFEDSNVPVLTAVSHKQDADASYAWDFCDRYERASQGVFRALRCEDNSAA